MLLGRYLSNVTRENVTATSALRSRAHRHAVEGADRSIQCALPIALPLPCLYDNPLESSRTPIYAHRPHTHTHRDSPLTLTHSHTHTHNPPTPSLPVAEHSIDKSLQSAIASMVKEGLPDNPLEVIAAKLLAMAATAGRPYPKAPRQPSRSVLPNPSLPNLSRTYPEAPPRPPRSSVLPNSAVCFPPF